MTTMGIVQVEELKLRQQEIEVKALVALAEHGVSPQRYRALDKLEDIAYPKDLANKINKDPVIEKWL